MGQSVAWRGAHRLLHHSTGRKKCWEGTADDAANDGARVVVVVLLLDARGDGHEDRGPVA